MDSGITSSIAHLTSDLPNSCPNAAYKSMAGSAISFSVLASLHVVRVLRVLAAHRIKGASPHVKRKWFIHVARIEGRE